MICQLSVSRADLEAIALALASGQTVDLGTIPAGAVITGGFDPWSSPDRATLLTYEVPDKIPPTFSLGFTTST